MGVGTSNEGWKQMEWYVREKLINNIYDKLTQFYGNNIIHKTPENIHKT